MYSDEILPSSTSRYDEIPSGEPKGIWRRPESRRQFLTRAGKIMAVGGLTTLLGRNGDLLAALAERNPTISQQSAPKASRVIQLFMAGGPSQLETWDYKPALASHTNRKFPESASQTIAPSAFRFRQHGQAGHWISEIFPQTARVADELAVIKSMHTDGNLHSSAIQQMLAGCSSGSTSIRSQIAQALGTTDPRLPAFATLQTNEKSPMVSDLTDLSNEPASTWKLYGNSARIPGTFAHHALLARRFAEEGVRFTQVFHPGWDTHSHLPDRMKKLGNEIDRPIFALLTDLRQRGLLDETLVIWGGEFGRTAHSQSSFNRKLYGRDHHADCFSAWMAGGGIRAGISYGETDDFSRKIVKDPVHVRDLHTTILHLLGLDPEAIQGIESGQIIRGLFA